MPRPLKAKHYNFRYNMETDAILRRRAIREGWPTYSALINTILREAAVRELKLEKKFEQRGYKESQNYMILND